MTPPPDNSDPRDYILDLSSAPPASPIEKQKSEMGGGKNQKSAYLSIYFRCCSVYAPIYKNAAGTAYAGHCPRCHRAASIAIGPNGSRSRIFQAE